MTSATEQLRALLDERGVKTYHEQNYITWDDTNDYQCFAFETYERPGLLRVHCNLAPEQAIAATLGGQPARLTAEQVRDAVLENFEETHETRYDHWEPSKFDWQEIADELNAELGRGTCKPTEEDYCSICGEDLVKCNVGIGELGGAVELDPPIYHNYCPNCGAKVVKR